MDRGQLIKNDSSKLKKNIFDSLGYNVLKLFGVSSYIY